MQSYLNQTKFPIQINVVVINQTNISYLDRVRYKYRQPFVVKVRA